MADKDSEKESQTTADVSAILEQAQAQYEVYFQLAQLASFTSSIQEEQPSKFSWERPLGLVLKLD